MLDFLKQGRITLEQVEKSIKELPLPEKVKAIAIYKRYREIKRIEDEMEKATREIERKYLKFDEPIFNNISELVGGNRAIKQDELKDLPKYLSEEEIKQAPEHLGAKKIEGYWWKCFNSAPMIREAMGKDDEQLLKHLDRVQVIDEEGTDNFTIRFTFSDNEIIKNKELSIRFEVKEGSPVKSTATEIEWVSKNLTMKEIKKKQKNKKTGQQRVVTRQVKAKSFFNFFRSLDLTGAGDKPDPLEANEEELKQYEEIETDFEIAGVIVDEVLPYSLEYFLGIEHEGDEDFMGDEEEGSDNESDEEAPKKKKEKKSSSKSKSRSKGKDKKEPAKAEEKPECKNQ